MIKVINAHFTQSCERFSQAPSILGAEIAILGRSNVGKSSLINALLNNKNLAKSSSTPGKTRLINFFNAKWRVDSAESQNLNQNNLRVSANLESRPLRGAKNQIQASSSASADFLLEAEKRGSPPKSEKAAAFWRAGGAGRGVQPFLRKENSDESVETKRDFSPTAQNDNFGEKIVESSVVSADSQNLKNRLPRRFCESARNDDSFLDSAPSTNEANSSIFDEKSGLCSCERGNRTNGSLTKRATNLPDLSHPTGCEALAEAKKDAEFEVRILDFPGFGYAKVSKVEKSSWDRHLSEFLKKRDSIKLYLHLIDSRHQNLEIDDEIFAFLNRFKRGDCAILQVFTKADKLSKNELSRLKKQNKLYHSINDKNSTEILRCAILKLLYNVDF